MGDYRDSNEIRLDGIYSNQIDQETLLEKILEQADKTNKFLEQINTVITTWQASASERMLAAAKQFAEVLQAITEQMKSEEAAAQPVVKNAPTGELVKSAPSAPYKVEPPTNEKPSLQEMYNQSTFAKFPSGGVNDSVELNSSFINHIAPFNPNPSSMMFTNNYTCRKCGFNTNSWDIYQLHNDTSSCAVPPVKRAEPESAVSNQSSDPSDPGDEAKWVCDWCRFSTTSFTQYMEHRASKYCQVIIPKTVQPAEASKEPYNPYNFFMGNYTCQHCSFVTRHMQDYERHLYTSEDCPGAKKPTTKKFRYNCEPHNFHSNNIIEFGRHNDHPFSSIYCVIFIDNTVKLW
jgi:hypothetical protein